jgi:hypothetical protein
MPDSQNGSVALTVTGHRRTENTFRWSGTFSIRFGLHTRFLPLLPTASQSAYRELQLEFGRSVLKVTDLA